MTVKFLFNGLRVDKTLYKAFYSNGPYNEHSKLPSETITLRAKDYSTDFPVLEGTAVENGSDTQADYYEKDTMRIFPDSPYFADAKIALEKSRARIKI